MANLLNSIREGMTVVDRDGETVGTVDFVQLSDENPDTPVTETTTAPDDGSARSGLMEMLADVFRSDELPDPIRARLMRNGFARIDGAGLFASDRYVLPDQIERVSGDTVTLLAARGDLVREP